MTEQAGMVELKQLEVIALTRIVVAVARLHLNFDPSSFKADASAVNGILR